MSLCRHPLASAPRGGLRLPAPAFAGTRLSALAFSALLAVAGAARAGDPAPATPDAPGAGAADDQVVVPEVARRDVHRPKYPSNDFEVGLFAGGLSVQNFGVHGDIGARLGYEITEDYFVEADYAQSIVSDATFRQILPGGVFPYKIQRLQYYDLNIGYNVLPGEVFIGKNWARASSLFLVAGVGSTSFDKQRMQTYDYGIGARLFLADWISLRADVRNHVFKSDLLGKPQTLQNPELTLGTSLYF